MSETEPEKKWVQKSPIDSTIARDKTQCGPNGDRKGTKKRSNQRDDHGKPCQAHAHDVLFGRGNGVGKHIGNMHFHQLVVPSKKEYRKAKCRGDRRKVAFNIIKQIKNLDPPGRFLIPDGPHQVIWHEVRDHRAMMKTSQALREQVQSNRDPFIKIKVVDKKICVESSRSLDKACGSNPVEESGIQPYPWTYNLCSPEGPQGSPRNSETSTDMCTDERQQSILKEEYKHFNDISCIDRETETNEPTQDDDCSSSSNISDLVDLNHNMTKSSMETDPHCSSQEDTNIELGTTPSSDVRLNVNNGYLSTVRNKCAIPSIEKIDLDNFMNMAKGSSLPAISPNGTKMMSSPSSIDPSCNPPSNQTNKIRSPFASANNVAENTMAEASLTVLLKAEQINAAQHSLRTQFFDFNSDRIEGKLQPTLENTSNNNTSLSNERTMNILMKAARNEYVVKSLQATSELKNLLTHLKPNEPNIDSQAPNSTLRSVSNVTGKSQPGSEYSHFLSTSSNVSSLNQNKATREKRMHIMNQEVHNKNVPQSDLVTAEIKTLSTQLPLDTNESPNTKVDVDNQNKILTEAAAINILINAAEAKNAPQGYQPSTENYESKIAGTPSLMLEYAPNFSVNNPHSSNKNQDKTQLAAALINILMNHSPAQTKNVTQSHNSDINNFSMQILPEKSKRDLQPFLADESHTNVVDGKSRSEKLQPGSDYHSSPFCDHNQNETLIETSNISMKPTQITSTTQDYEPIPEKCTINMTGSSLTESEHTTSFNNSSSFSCETQNKKIRETPHVNIFMQAAQNKNAQQIHQPSLGNTHRAGINPVERYRDFQYEAGVSKNVLNIQQNSGKIYESKELDSDIMDIDSVGEYSGVISHPSTIITYDDELEGKKQEAQSEKPSKKLKIQNDYKKFIMPLSYIGQSFTTCHLNQESLVTNESKAVFEELVELGCKGESAVMYLPSVVGSLCQRIIDLEKQLSK